MVQLKAKDRIGSNTEDIVIEYPAELSIRGVANSDINTARLVISEDTNGTNGVVFEVQGGANLLKLFGKLGATETEVFRYYYANSTKTLFGFGGSVDNSAMIAMTTTTQGFLPPRMTTTQRDAITSPATGLVIYNTTTNKLNVYTGSAWEAVTSA